MALNVSKPASVRSNGDRQMATQSKPAAAALTAGAQDRDCLVLVELALRRHLVVRDRVLLEPRDVGDVRFGQARRQHDPAAGQQRRLAAAGAAHVELVAARRRVADRRHFRASPDVQHPVLRQLVGVRREHVGLRVEAVLVHEVREEQLLVDVAALQPAEQRVPVVPQVVLARQLGAAAAGVALVDGDEVAVARELAEEGSSRLAPFEQHVVSASLFHEVRQLHAREPSAHDAVVVRLGRRGRCAVHGAGGERRAEQQRPHLRRGCTRKYPVPRVVR